MASMLTGFAGVHLNGRLHDRQPRTSQIWPTAARGRTHVRAETVISFCCSYEEAENVMLSRVRKQLLGKRFAGRKLIVALAGIPGSGKSTCAHNLVKKLNQVHEVAVTVPMDGFHFYRCDLDRMPDPAHAHDRRGAAFTINAPVFVECLRRLVDEKQIAHPIPFPSFDHAVGDPVQDDVWVKPEHQVVVVEGLYLLRDEQPWGELDEIFDDKWLLRTHVDDAMDNVVARQVEMGAHEADARYRVNANDRVNALEVYGICRRPDFIIDVSAAA